MLFGRSAECEEIAAALDAARQGGSAALVLRGEPGSGKSALLDFAATRAAHMRVLRAGGVEVEAEFPYATLHMLLRPIMDTVERLPSPQSEALRTAFGLADGGAVNSFLVGLATLTMLSETADEVPVLCLIDDAQWIDSPSADALGFAARRLHADSVAMLFGARRTGTRFRADGLPEMPVNDLDAEAARALLTEAGVPATRHRALLDATGGNPLGLRELARHGDPELPHGVQALFHAEVERQPAWLRRFLLVAAAEDSGEPRDITAAARVLGLRDDGIDAAVSGGMLLREGKRVAFRHPLIRAAVYQSATDQDRRAVHRAWAQVYAAEDDRAVWHAAAACEGYDTRISDALAIAASRAASRGGQAAVATMLERAARLSQDPRSRARRLVDAAEAAADCGQHDRAHELASQASRPDMDEVRYSRVVEMRAENELINGSVDRARALFLAGARDVGADNAERAIILCTQLVNLGLEWGESSWITEALDAMAPFVDRTAGHFQVAVAACHGVHAVITDDPERGVPALRKLGEVMRPVRGGLPGARHFAANLAVLAGDLELASDMESEILDECRTSGMLGWLPTLHASWALTLFRLGRFGDARVSVSEGLDLAADLGQQRIRSALRAVAALLDATNDKGEDVAAEDDSTATRIVAAWAASLRDLVAGRHEAAADRWSRVMAGPGRDTAAAYGWFPDYVESAVRGGITQGLDEDVARFRRWVDATGSAAARALALRCEALLGAEENTVAALEAALTEHEKQPRAFDTARTRLLYGQALRRQQHKTEARRQLRAAMETFERLRATAWAEQAAAELRATGETRPAREGLPEGKDQLTPQELQVARLAATGATNRDIAARLFLSPRTVGHHLYRAYPKLGISKRTELARLFAAEH